jgi:serine/threonine-protein kinase
MAEALERAHELGIVHRDLKPDNVMLVERQGDPDFVKVLDFGIAKVPVDELPSMQPSPGSNPDKPLTRVGRIYGTPEYMAPEQAAGEVVDARADLYALGIVLYEMLSGRRPFESESLPQMLAMQLTAKPPRFSEKCPSRAIPAKVEALVFAMLEKDPAVRPASAKAVREQLEELLREGATPTLGGVAGAHGRDSASRWERWEKEPSTTDKETRGSRWPMRYGAAFGLGALTLALVYGVTRPKPDTKTPPLAVSEKTVEESSRASAQALQQASAAGTEALAALADQFPEDPAILRALVLAYRRDKQWAIAVHTAKSWVRLVGAATDDDEVTDAIVATAQNGGEAQEPALELLASSLGGRGVEELYELATSTKGGALKAKAWAQVSKAEVRDRASRATAFLIEFRTANGCEARRGLLARARSEADGRALVLLKPLAYPKGCGFLGLSDCHPCFRKEPFRSELKETLALLESKRTPPSK